MTESDFIYSLNFNTEIDNIDNNFCHFIIFLGEGLLNSVLAQSLLYIGTFKLIKNKIKVTIIKYIMIKSA